MRSLELGFQFVKKMTFKIIPTVLLSCFTSLLCPSTILESKSTSQVLELQTGLQCLHDLKGAILKSTNVIF